jgi:DNA-binding transcriptional ArsR family regulator
MDSSRALILSVLADGRALPAGELARIARISPQTASSHLDKLFKGNLVSVEVQGRHHYYRLRDSDVAELLESLSVVARPTAPLTSAQRERAEIRLQLEPGASSEGAKIDVLDVEPHTEPPARLVASLAVAEE